MYTFMIAQGLRYLLSCELHSTVAIQANLTMSRPCKALESHFFRSSQVSPGLAFCPYGVFIRTGSARFSFPAGISRAALQRLLFAAATFKGVLCIVHRHKCKRV